MKNKGLTQKQAERILYLAMAFFALVPIVLLLVLKLHPREAEKPPPAAATGQEPAPVEVVDGNPGEKRGESPRPSRSTEERSALADRLNAKNGNIGEDLAILREVVLAYHLHFKENPIGLHEEIVASLTGQNQDGLAFIPPDHPALRDGQLLDRWGTPFRFHTLARDTMEIRSAGPDRQFATEDDFLLYQ